MPLVLHKVLKSGEIQHQEFSKESWEDAMRDPSLASFWGHPPSECYSIVARHFAQLRRQGFACDARQHALADQDDPSWSGNREIILVQTTQDCPPPPEPVEWPPSSDLTAKMLSDMSGVGIDDCKLMLQAPRKVLPEIGHRPPVEGSGQFQFEF